MTIAHTVASLDGCVWHRGGTTQVFQCACILARWQPSLCPSAFFESAPVYGGNECALSADILQLGRLGRHSPKGLAAEFAPLVVLAGCVVSICLVSPPTAGNTDLFDACLSVHSVFATLWVVTCMATAQRMPAR